MLKIELKGWDLKQELLLLTIAQEKLVMIHNVFEHAFKDKSFLVTGNCLPLLLNTEKPQKAKMACCWHSLFGIN